MPALVCRIMPARSMRRWEAICASAGVSFSVGRKARDRRKADSWEERSFSSPFRPELPRRGWGRHGRKRQSRPRSRRCNFLSYVQRNTHEGQRIPTKSEYSILASRGRCDRQKKGRTQRARPEFREETPVTRQREDQPSPCKHGDAETERRTTAKASEKAEKNGSQARTAQHAGDTGPKTGKSLIFRAEPASPTGN